ncbi:MAG: hypothetical protein ACKV1O_10140 [Saprospiraceae bacterium]
MEYEGGLTHWRQRRNTRLSWSSNELVLLSETPVLQMVSTQNRPISAVPAARMHFVENPVSGEVQNKSQTGGNIRIVYVSFGPKERERMILQWQSRRDLYKGNMRWQMRISRIIDNIRNCRKPHHWRQSEEDIKQQYAYRFPRQISQQAFSNGARQSGRVAGSTVPDLVLPAGARKNLALRSKQELELIEVKFSNLSNIGSMSNKLTKQILDRSKISPGGRYQSVVLDFRGKEKDCTAIKAAARKIAYDLRTKTTGIHILVQVLMWAGCPDACQLPNEQIQ